MEFAIIFLFFRSIEPYFPLKAKKFILHSGRFYDILKLKSAGREIIMAIFDNPFSLEFTVHVGYLDIIVFINENLYVTSNECNSVPHNHHD